jgi:hypothetical protein
MEYVLKFPAPPKPKKRSDSTTSIVTVIHSPLPSLKPHVHPTTFFSLPLELRQTILSIFFHPDCTCSRSGWDWHNSVSESSTWAYLGRHTVYSPHLSCPHPRPCLARRLDVLRVCRSLHRDAKEVFIREHVRRKGFLRDNVLCMERFWSLRRFVEGSTTIETEFRVQIRFPQHGTAGRMNAVEEKWRLVRLLEGYFDRYGWRVVATERKYESYSSGFWEGVVFREVLGRGWMISERGWNDGRSEICVKGPLLVLEDGRSEIDVLLDE